MISSKSDTGTVAGGNKKSNAFPDIPYTGDIEDADFEEIEDR